jgi:hypothetical protein
MELRGSYFQNRSIIFYFPKLMIIFDLSHSVNFSVLLAYLLLAFFILGIINFLIIFETGKYILKNALR